MIIVNAVITPITQQKKGKKFWVNIFWGGLHNCKVGSVFYLSATAIFLILLCTSLSSSLSSPQQSPMTVGSDQYRHRVSCKWGNYLYLAAFRWFSYNLQKSQTISTQLFFFLTLCFINPWPFPSMVTTQISFQLLKSAWTFNAHARCPSMVLPEYWYGHTLLSTHPRIRARYRCVQTFSV